VGRVLCLSFYSQFTLGQMLDLARFGLLLAMVVSQGPGQDVSNRECAPEGLIAGVQLSYWPPSIFLQQRIRFRPSCIQGIN
jgi:hypothetical protein